MEKSSSSGDSSRKRHLDIGAGTSAGASAPKKHSSSSDDGEKETPIDKSPSQISVSVSSKIPTYEGRYKKDFEEEELIGKGGYGKVYRCKNRLDDSEYAVKVIPFKDDNLESFLREVKILATVHHHQGIIHYYQSWIEDGTPDCGSGSDDQELFDGATKTLYIVMELCRRSLYGLLGSKNEIHEEDAMRIFVESLEALKYIHESGFLHGDISRDNIFLTAEGQVKIGDFGLARKFGDDHIPNSLGNLTYRAPELLIDPMSISAKSDMFALGLVAFETFNRMVTDNERFEEFRELKKDSKVRGALKGTFIGSIIEDLLAKDPKLRPSAAEVLVRLI